MLTDSKVFAIDFRSSEPACYLYVEDAPPNILKWDQFHPCL